MRKAETFVYPVDAIRTFAKRDLGSEDVISKFLSVFSKHYVTTRETDGGDASTGGFSGGYDTNHVEILRLAFFLDLERLTSSSSRAELQKMVTFCYSLWPIFEKDERLAGVGFDLQEYADQLQTAANTERLALAATLKHDWRTDSVLFESK